MFFSKWHLIKGVFHCNLICINLRLNMCVLVYMLHRFVAAYLCSHIHSVILVYNVLFSMQSGDRVEVEKHPIYSPIPCSQTQRNYFISQSGLRWSKLLLHPSSSSIKAEICISSAGHNHVWKFNGFDLLLLLRCASFLSSPQNHLKKSIASFFHKLRTLQGSYNTRRTE